MIKKFLQCTSIRERIDLLSSTVLSDWSDQDLNYVLSALNLPNNEKDSKGDKISMIEKYLADYKKQVEQQGSMDCKAIDSVPARDEGETLYQEKGAAEVLSRAINNLQ